MDCLRTRKDGSVVLRLYVQPRSSKNELAGLHDGALKLRLTTPPVDGKANKAVLVFLARLLGVPKSSLSLISGQKNRCKQICVQGMDEKEIAEKLFPV
jgi:uncharacterized protein (TIGR00251 family)